MLIGRQPRTTSESLKFIVMIAMAVFVVSSTAMSQEIKDNLSKKVGSSYKKTEQVASVNFKSKTEINKGNLESLSSSLAGYIETVSNTSAVNSDEVMYKVIEYLNTPYLWGGTSKRGIDCSAFVQAVMYQALGVALPRTSLEQSGVGTEVEVKDLKFGDLLFFDTMHKGRVTHVGMYLSDGYFVHSGSSTGVIVTSLEKETYAKAFLKAKRVIEQ
ncbi:MAG: C40 family peptidase [Bacteroidetes bacterium]|nr:C40 family peptidase [Bacteroidota bacterium]